MPPEEETGFQEFSSFSSKIYLKIFISCEFIKCETSITDIRFFFGGGGG